MTKHLRNVLEGFAQALQVYPSRDYVQPKTNGFAQDQAALRGDAVKIVRGLKQNADKVNVKQGNAGSGTKR
ncbi:hypothetical protein [Chromobacterium vaccinii]|uniref:hypothetical protein n=1 Tax=Chromobacterium vaccinii TaxID=1108595 RepID=UPI00131A3539|nr:hypothetical protein [Chromobacterium vaccinii]